MSKLSDSVPTPLLDTLFLYKQRMDDRILFFDDDNIQTFPKRDLYRRDFNSCSISLKNEMINIGFLTFLPSYFITEALLSS